MSGKICYNSIKYNLTEAVDMGGYIKTYMKNVENALKDDSTDLDELKRQHLVQLQFIQHERLVHLLVTIMCCILMFIGFLIFFVSGIRAIMIVNGLLLILCFNLARDRIIGCCSRTCCTQVHHPTQRPARSP